MIDIVVSDLLSRILFFVIVIYLVICCMRKTDRHKKHLASQLNSLYAIIDKHPDRDQIIMQAHEQHILDIKNNEKSS